MSRTRLTSILVIVGAFALITGFAVWLVDANRRARQHLEEQRLWYRQKWIETQLSDIKNGTSDILYFYTTEQTDDLLRIFQEMPEVRRISFEGTDLSQDGMTMVESFSNLREFKFYGGTLNDMGLQHLRGNKQLEALKLINTDVTDRGLDVLHQLPKLRSLTLYRDGFRAVTLTDGALATLRQFTNLEEINISGGWASTEVIERLRTELPECTISTESQW